MRPTIKFSIILIVTLAIGIAIGFEISEISIRKHFEEPERFRKPEGFVNIFEDVIQPNNEQKPVVDSILLKYHTKIDTLARNSMFEVTLQMDSMRLSLEKVLDKEQINRLNEEMARMPRVRPEGRGMRMRSELPGNGPMPGGPPPDMKMRRDFPDDMRDRREPSPERRP